MNASPYRDMSTVYPSAGYTLMLRRHKRRAHTIEAPGPRDNPLRQLPSQTLRVHEMRKKKVGNDNHSSTKNLTGFWGGIYPSCINRFRHIPSHLWNGLGSLGLPPPLLGLSIPGVLCRTALQKNASYQFQKKLFWKRLSNDSTCIPQIMRNGGTKIVSNRY